MMMGRAARIKKNAVSQGFANKPTNLDPFLRALDALRSGNKPAAIVLFRQIIAERPGLPRVHFHLAMALRELPQLAEAIEHYRLAIALDRGYVDAYVNLGEALRRAGRPRDAVTACDQAIAIAADHAEAYVIRGVAQKDLGNVAESIRDLQAAITQDPSMANGYKLLGKVLLSLDRKQEALDILRQGVLVEPDDAEVLRSIGDLCENLGLFWEGFAAYRRSIEIDSYNVQTYTNLAGLLCQTRLLDEALCVADVGIKIAPDCSGLHFNRGVALEQKRRFGEAALAYAEALRCDPLSGRSLVSVCRLRRYMCDWEGLAASEGLAQTLTYRKGHAIPPFGALFLTSRLVDIYDCNRVWAKSIDTRHPALAPYQPREAHRRTERIRVGYLSADFHTHATAALIVELFELHDKMHFETWGYSIGAPDAGAMRQRLVGALDHFVDVSTISHDEAAAKIREDEIDILIDLKGYTYQARTEILIRRPAPIQVSFLGYPSTMGARFIDYIIGDPVVTPMEHQRFYSEKIVQVPNSYQPNDRKRILAPEIPTRAECGLPEHGVVFCCFNSNYKINPPVFDIWMRLLRDTPESVLWLYAENPDVRDNLRREAAARHIDPLRIVFAPKVPTPEHLTRMRLGDLFLDTSPVGAHTTASEALWTGLPLITFLGETFAARVAASLLVAVGLPELVTTSLAEYETVARRLAQCPDELRAIKTRLTTNIATTPLFDTARYARDFESALTRMVELRDAGEEPRPIAI